MPLSYPEALHVCQEGIAKYAALRPELFRQLLSLKQQPGGPWRVQYKCDPSEGERELPVKFSHQTCTDIEFDGHAFNGIAVLRTPHAHEPFHDFTLLDSADNPPASGSEAGVNGMRLKFLLQQLLDTMKSLAGALMIIERHHDRAAVDTVPLSRLALALPVFPYWPRIKGMEQADFDQIIANEKPLLNEALLTLHRLRLGAESAGAGGSAKPGGPIEGDWLIPMPLAEMANRLGNIGTKKVKALLKPYGLKKHAGNRQLWTVRLDAMPQNQRKKLEAVK
jgi:hypothetical protein